MFEHLANCHGELAFLAALFGIGSWPGWHYFKKLTRRSGVVKTSELIASSGKIHFNCPSCLQRNYIPPETLAKGVEYSHKNCLSCGIALKWVDDGVNVGFANMEELAENRVRGSNVLPFPRRENDPG